MRRVTGGGAPAEIWKTFMTQALPRLRAQPIPGGVVEPPPPEPDPIGDLLGAVGIGEPPAPAPQPQPQTQPQELPY
jgi:penicillin-binding protein 1A